MKKGVSVILSHSTFLAVGIVALMMVLIFVFNISANIRENSIISQLDFAADSIKFEILKMYELSERSNLHPREGETILIKEIDVDIPEKIAEKRYTIKLFSNNITVTTNIDNEIIETSRNVNALIIIDGEAITPVKLRLERTNNNGLIVDEVKLIE